MTVASHLTALAAKGIVQRYYGRPANKSYFYGLLGRRHSGDDTGTAISMGL